MPIIVQRNGFVESAMATAPDGMATAPDGDGVTDLTPAATLAWAEKKANKLRTTVDNRLCVRRPYAPPKLTAISPDDARVVAMRESK